MNPTLDTIAQAPAAIVPTAADVSLQISELTIDELAIVGGASMVYVAE
jgi:hypothetical protein